MKGLSRKNSGHKVSWSCLDKTDESFNRWIFWQYVDELFVVIVWCVRSYLQHIGTFASAKIIWFPPFNAVVIVIIPMIITDHGH